MLTDCCTRYLGRGEAVCPACGAQAEVHRNELDGARSFHTNADALNQDTRELLQRRAVLPESLGLPASTRKHALARKNPARRAVFQLLGIYLPEREAKALLRKIHEFKWIEAEKAGCDIWRKREPQAPLKAAAETWASNYLPQFLQYNEREAA